jgi:hypothetical protein
MRFTLAKSLGVKFLSVHPLPAAPLGNGSLDLKRGVVMKEGAPSLIPGESL